jgi:hypothetical protein
LLVALKLRSRVDDAADEKIDERGRRTLPLLLLLAPPPPLLAVEVKLRARKDSPSPRESRLRDKATNATSLLRRAGMALVANETDDDTTTDDIAAGLGTRTNGARHVSSSQNTIANENTSVLNEMGSTASSSGAWRRPREKHKCQLKDNCR